MPLASAELECGWPCSVHKGDQLPEHVQQHLEEAMQPDGVDLEYVYLPGSSRPASAPQQHPTAQESPAALVDSQRHHAAPGFEELPRPAMPSYTASDMFGDVGAAAMLPVRRQDYYGLRPATAQPRRREWDDSPAGAPPRAQAQPLVAQSGGRLRPQSAGHARRGRGASGAGLVDSETFEDHQALWGHRGPGHPDHPAALLTGVQHTPYTQEFLSRHGRQEGLQGYFQSPTGSWYPAMAESPSIRHAWQVGSTVGGSRAPAQYAAGKAQDMQQVYAEQINEMLRYANQCAAALGLRHRYKACRRRPSSAMASRSSVPSAFEGYVERHNISVCCQLLAVCYVFMAWPPAPGDTWTKVEFRSWRIIYVQADGAGVVNDPGQTKVLTYAKFASVVEGLSIRVNSSRTFATPSQRTSKRRKPASRRKVPSSGQSKPAAYGQS